MPAYVEYLRTNYAACHFDLTNYIYRPSDKVEIVFRHHAAPNYMTDWPTLCGTVIPGTASAAFFVQWNLWSSRTCLNVRHWYGYSGDSNFSYNSPYDYENYYKFTMDGNAFHLGKSSTLDNFTDITTGNVGANDNSDTDTLKLFNSAAPADIELYQVTITRAGTVIHDYKPTTTGLYDTIDNIEITSTGTGWVPGPIIPPPPSGHLTINLQYTASESNRVNKEISEIATYVGTLRQATSIIDPVFTVYCDLLDVVNANYLTVPDFGRSYFINNIRSIKQGLVEFSCHVDVLSSFKEELLSNNAIINRSERNWNLYINDGSLKVKQNPLVTTQGFPNGFGTDYSFILVIAG